MKKITLLFLLLTVSLSFGQELIVNGGLEDGVYAPFEGSGTAASNNAYEGAWRMNLKNDFAVAYQTFSTTPGEEYTVSFYYQLSNTGVTAGDGPTVSIRTGDGSTIIYNSYLDESVTTYTEVTFTFVATSTSSQWRMFSPDRSDKVANQNNAVRVDNISVVPSSSLSLTDLEKFNFKSYPNPTTDYVILSAAKNIDKIEVYNLLGKQVVKQAISNTRGEVNVSNLASGLYIMKAYIEDASGTFKFVKQ